MRFNDFKSIMDGGYVGNELSMRNNAKIRKLFSEIICVLCNSHKRNPLSNIKIDPKDFNLQNLTGKLKADSLDYASLIAAVSAVETASWTSRSHWPCPYATTAHVYSSRYCTIFHLYRRAGNGYCDRFFTGHVHKLCIPCDNGRYPFKVWCNDDP